MQNFLFGYQDVLSTVHAQHPRVLMSCQLGYSVLNPREVWYCETEDKHHSKWHLKDGRSVLVKSNLKASLEILEPFNFIAVNGSVIVNLLAIVQITKGEDAKVILSNQVEFTLSVNKRKELMQHLKKYGDSSQKSCENF